ncbi:unnamed protein product, partial [Arabidopsis halleri]
MEEGQSYEVIDKIDIRFRKCYLEEYVEEEVQRGVCIDEL